MNRKLYVTTAIPYVNAAPHVGFALELVQADVIARLGRLLGRPVRFQTGTDENALKNVLSAAKLGISPTELADRNSHQYRRLLEALNISADSFLRTTEDRHRLGVQEFWRRLRPGDVYRKTYRGLYCPGCEDFYLPKDLIDGRCPEHLSPPLELAEENYFFRLSAWQGQIEQLLESGRIEVVPAARRNEVLRFVRGGLRDFSISRPAARAEGWGIPVPGEASQVVYVWVDALVNYISGCGYGRGDDWRAWWNGDAEKVHVIGKNVWKFHAVYWPALLLSCGLDLPDRIVVHGFVTADGQKIGKSLGNAVDPFALVEAFGTDAVRHYLLTAIPPFDDGDFSLQRLRRLYRSDLANGLGNLVGRLTSLCERSAFGRCQAPAAPGPPEGFLAALERYEFDKAAGALWRVVDQLNRQIEQARPWELLKAGDPQPLRNHLSQWLEDLHALAYWLEPLLPGTSRRILRALSQPAIKACPPLFPRQAEDPGGPGK